MTEATRLVLIVDDDASVRGGLSRLLRSAGYRIATASGAQKVLEFGIDKDTACLLLDIDMPGLNGMDLHQWLIDHGIRVPVVFLTGHGDIPQSVLAIKRGAVDFLTKPVDEVALFAAVDRAMGLHDGTESGDVAELRARLARLSEREHQVVTLLLGGMKNRDVAEQLGIAEKTVKVHRSRVMEKMAASSAVDLGQLCAVAGMKPTPR
jgi:FixJ family two-component response regulator